MILMVEAASHPPPQTHTTNSDFYQEFLKNLPVPRCVVLQHCKDLSNGPERAFHSTLVGRACLVPVVHGCGVASDAWSV